MDSREPWVVPFVVQLTGEHVLQIREAIGRRLPGLAVPGSAPRQPYGPPGGLPRIRAGTGMRTVAPPHTASVGECGKFGRLSRACPDMPNAGGEGAVRGVVRSGSDE